MRNYLGLNVMRPNEILMKEGKTIVCSYPTSLKLKPFSTRSNILYRVGRKNSLCLWS